MALQPATRRAIVAAVVVWAVSMAALAVGGLATGVWRLSDLWGRAGAAFLGEFGLLATVGSFLLIGGPVLLWQRERVVAPLIALVCYVAYFAYLGASADVGFSAMYVAVMYGPLAIVGMSVLASLEWALRRVRPGEPRETG